MASARSGNWGTRLFRVIGLENNFSRRQRFERRVSDARSRIKALRSADHNWNDEAISSIEKELEGAEKLLIDDGPFEPILRSVTTAEHRLLEYVRSDEAARVIGELRNEVAVFVPPTQQTPILERLFAAETKLQAGDDPGRQTELLLAKQALDTATLEGYRARERLRDRITILGFVLLIFDVLFLTVFTFAEVFSNSSLFTIRASDGDLVANGAVAL